MKRLFDKMFSAFNMQRWNDHIKTVELTEMDKQAHKMIISFLIAKIEEEKGNKIDIQGLIEGSIFETLHRLVVTDIKPHVFHKIMENKREELNNWVISEIKDVALEGGADFFDKFQRYLCDDTYMKREKHILAAGHFLATENEFKLIYPANSYTYAIEATKDEIEKKVEKYIDIEGVREIKLKKGLADFVKICGQLRFQVRWAQSPRVPRTTVLGHMYFVALMSYFFSKKIGACEHRLANNFFTALFHDLPEVLTRDIVTPVKQSVADLDLIIKGIERDEMARLIYPLLPPYIVSELHYYTDDEFTNRIKKGEEVIKGLRADEISEKYNYAIYAPVDGEMLKVCDHMAAYMEAYKSINDYGIKSPELTGGVARLQEKYRGRKIAGIDLSTLFGIAEE